MNCCSRGELEPADDRRGKRLEWLEMEEICESRAPNNGRARHEPAGDDEERLAPMSLPLPHKVKSSIVRSKSRTAALCFLLLVLGLALFVLGREIGTLEEHAADGEAKSLPQATAISAKYGANGLSRTQTAAADPWDRPPRVVILSGPHKTASTTLQTFLYKVAGSAVSFADDHSRDDGRTRRQLKRSEKRPHPDVRDWVFPVGLKEDYGSEIRKGSNPAKFYAPLASYASGRRRTYFLTRLSEATTEEEREEILENVRAYYKELFRRPWEEGKNIVIAAEAFDTLVKPLGSEEATLGSEGESLHVAKDSEAMIDALLGVLPWEEEGEDAATNTTTTPALQISDIEVHIHYRTPRVGHLQSVWHQLGGKGSSLREFYGEKGDRGLIDEGQDKQGKGLSNLYWLNSLALALQYVRHGIRTTVVDMRGVAERSFDRESQTTITNTTSTTRPIDKEDPTVIGGLEGVLACEILRIGSSSTKNNNGDLEGGGPKVCDDEGLLHLEGYKPANKNQKEDRGKMDLTAEELEGIDGLLQAYDCGVWEHLVKYRDAGLLRILHPSRDLFKSCGDGRAVRKGLPFHRLLGEIKGIMTGPPASTTEEKRAK